ncbi:MAG TPA: hypothetical protein VIF62_05870 [Labilithrix sp.]
MTEETKEERAPGAEPQEQHSLVDAAFDKLSVWAAQGLEAAKRGLETGARWLDARAKRFGEVATKLAPSRAKAAE